MDTVESERTTGEAGGGWRWGAAGLLVAALVAAALWWRWWDLSAFFAWQREAGPVPFFLALAILPAIGFPTTPFYVLAGAMFGVVGGLIGSAVSLAINLLLCFWIARSGLRRWLEAILARTAYRLPTMEGSRAIGFALLVKLTPGAPTTIKTYIIALSGVPFWAYFVLSFTITFAWAAGFIVLGESLLDRDFGQAGWALAALALLALAVWWGRRFWKRRQ